MKLLKVILGALLAQFVVLLAAQFASCQTDKLDIIEYTPPKGWTKILKQATTIYTGSDQATGGFCIITVYPSTASTGDVQKDFASEWNELIVKPFKAGTSPKTQTQTEDGWTSVSGASQIESDGTKSAVLVTVISGYGRAATVFAILNNQEFYPQVDAFITSIKMDKARASASSTPSTQDADYIDDPFPVDIFGARQPPLLGKLKKSITVADLAGKWEEGGASVVSYFDSSSGNYSSTDTTFSNSWYTIAPSGSFSFSFQGRASNHTVRETDTGTISLSGNIITVNFKQRAIERYQFIAFMTQPNGAAALSLIRLGTDSAYEPDRLRAICGHGKGVITCGPSSQTWARPPSK